MTVCAVISVLLMALSSAAFFLLLDGGMSAGSLASASAELITLASSVALFLTVAFNHVAVTENTRWLVIMNMIVTVLLSADIFSWVINENTDYVTENILLYSFTYAVETLLYVVVWKLVRVLLLLRGKVYDVIDRGILVILFINWLIVITNPFTHILFSAEEGLIEYSGTNWIYLALDALIMLAGMTVVYVSPGKKEDKTAAAVLAASAFVGAFFNYIFKDFECAYSLSFVSLLFSFVFIFSGQTRELETKQKDIDLATKVQRSLIPKAPVLGSSGPYEISGKMVAANRIGGDFYDYYMIDGRHLAFLTGDVCEEGIPSALRMMQTVSTIRDFSEAGADAAAILNKVNESLCESNTDGYFVSAWFGLLDVSTGSLEFVNAGHRSPVILRADGSREQISFRAEVPLSVRKDTRYTVHGEALKKGDLLLLCTDGVYVSYAVSGFTDPIERMEKAVSDSEGALDRLCDTIIREADSGVPEGDEKEDMTVVALRFNGPAETEEGKA